MVTRDGAYGVGPTAGGRLPVRFVLKDYQASVPENTPPGSVILTAGVNKADSVSIDFYTIIKLFYLFICLFFFFKQNLRFWLVGAIEDMERFSITSSGELILKGTLDFERRTQHSFLVYVSDGFHVS